MPGSALRGITLRVPLRELDEASYGLLLLPG